MTRFMVDSTNIYDDPLTAQLVAYYVDGIYAVSEATVKARFPNSVLVPISAIGTNNGIVGDVEPGCMSVPQAVEWVKQRRAAGVDPTLYVNQTYGWAPMRQALQAAGVLEPHWWVANYDGVDLVPSGAVAKQYANPTLTHGHFDLSVVADFWPGIDIRIRLGENMFLRNKLNGNVVWTSPTQGYRSLSGAEWDAYAAQGAKFTDLDSATFNTVLAQITAGILPEPTASVDLSPVLIKIAEIKTEVDAIKVKTDKDLA